MKIYKFNAEIKKHEGKDATYIQVPIDVEIEKDEEERVVEVPKEFANLLNNNIEAKEFYESLSYSNKRKYIQWITSAKKEETKIKRMDEAIIKLKDKIKIKQGCLSWIYLIQQMRLRNRLILIE